MTPTGRMTLPRHCRMVKDTAEWSARSGFYHGTAANLCNIKIVEVKLGRAPIALLLRWRCLPQPAPQPAPPAVAHPPSAAQPPPSRRGAFSFSCRRRSWRGLRCQPACGSSACSPPRAMAPLRGALAAPPRRLLRRLHLRHLRAFW
jgi:hypothetical protein